MSDWRWLFRRVNVFVGVVPRHSRIRTHPCSSRAMGWIGSKHGVPTAGLYAPTAYDNIPLQSRQKNTPVVGFASCLWVLSVR